MNHPVFDVKGEPDGASEVEAVGTMLAEAAKHHLEAECVWSFGIGRSQGMGVEDAIQFAYREWDL